MVQMDGGDVRHSKLHVCYVHEEAAFAKRRVWRNNQEENCGETAGRGRGPADKASRQSAPQDRRKGDILNLDFQK